ncbi:unnamed protein product [Schistosoma curassoni]|uniref:DUF6451 domain-containing protein n=1 Tax=Schistosoma curassoni TaxID=6186 RepID=A0A183K6J0_9TREM|nr:unnamed protein product [Schistosoma curassoni]
MQEKTNSAAAVSAAVSLNIHEGKGKILRYNTECTNPITIDGEGFEDVKSFTYLDSIIDEHGGCDADVNVRIGKARAAYLQLRNIWNSKQLSTNTKVRIFNTNIDAEFFKYLVSSSIDEQGGSDADVKARIGKSRRAFLQLNNICNSTDNTDQVTLDGETLEDVESFTYLRCIIIDEQGGSDEDVKVRIGKSKTAFLQLNNICNSKQLSVNDVKTFTYLDSIID